MDLSTPIGPAACLAILADDPVPAMVETLIRLVGPDLGRLASRLTGRRDLAEDAVQEALMQAVRGARRFTPPPGADPDRAAWAWLRRITTTTTLFLLRGESRRQHREQAQAVNRADTVTPACPVEQADTRQHLRSALARLDEPFRTAIALHYLGGLDLAAIAAQEGCPTGTVKSRIHRGLQRLRQHLEPLGLAGAVASPALWDVLRHDDAGAQTLSLPSPSQVLALKPPCCDALALSQPRSLFMRLVIPSVAAAAAAGLLVGLVQHLQGAETPSAAAPSTTTTAPKPAPAADLLAPVVRELRREYPDLTESAARDLASRMFAGVDPSALLAIGGAAGVSTGPDGGAGNFVSTGSFTSGTGKEESGFTVIKSNTSTGTTTSPGVEPAQQRSTFRNDVCTATITTLQDKSRLRAVDQAGAVLFDGPIDTPQQRAKLPQVVRDLLGPDFDLQAGRDTRPPLPVEALHWQDGDLRAHGTQMGDGKLEVTVSRGAKVLYCGPWPADPKRQVPDEARRLLAGYPTRTPLTNHATTITTGDTAPRAAQ